MKEQVHAERHEPNDPLLAREEQGSGEEKEPRKAGFLHLARLDRPRLPRASRAIVAETYLKRNRQLCQEGQMDRKRGPRETG